MARGMAWARIWPRAVGWRHHRGGLWAGLLRLRALLWAALRLLPRSLLWAVLGTAPVLWLAPLRLASLSPLVEEFADRAQECWAAATPPWGRFCAGDTSVENPGDGS